MPSKEPHCTQRREQKRSLSEAHFNVAFMFYTIVFLLFPNVDLNPTPDPTWPLTLSQPNERHPMRYSTSLFGEIPPTFTADVSNRGRSHVCVRCVTGYQCHSDEHELPGYSSSWNQDISIKHPMDPINRRYDTFLTSIRWRSNSFSLTTDFSLDRCAELADDLLDFSLTGVIWDRLIVQNIIH